ncbi:uncharacterized protein LOC142825268 [Pelodiscus sinensis]|uniref:uncharacterized protein LOC142825268 n=1 Tax=Pelodiscus sinensis TaxID=13735 RepID=UPI003F6C2658
MTPDGLTSCSLPTYCEKTFLGERRLPSPLPGGKPPWLTQRREKLSAGLWRNELGSLMEIHDVNEAGEFSGEYLTAVTATSNCVRRSPLKGAQHHTKLRAQPTFGFTVNWEKFSNGIDPFPPLAGKWRWALRLLNLLLSLRYLELEPLGTFRRRQLLHSPCVVRLLHLLLPFDIRLLHLSTQLRKGALLFQLHFLQGLLLSNFFCNNICSIGWELLSCPLVIPHQQGRQLLLISLLHKVNASL